jgi:hypothetical protein
LVISIFCAPESAPQQYVSSAHAKAVFRLDCVDTRIIEVLRDVAPVKTWSLLNMLAREQSPNSRAEGRELRLNLLHRLKRLRKLQLIHGVGRNEISTQPPALLPTKRRKQSVKRRSVTRGVSVVIPERHAQQSEMEYTSGAKVIGGIEPRFLAADGPAKSESVATPTQASEAGRTLAKLPRHQPRKWTGFLHGRRAWRGMPLVLANGEMVRLYWTSRGRVLLEDANDLPHLPWLLRVARSEADVQIYRHRAAVLLGSRKAGVKEKPSALKQAAARLNGCRPVRVGNRPRGRPRLIQYSPASTRMGENS